MHHTASFHSATYHSIDRIGYDTSALPQLPAIEGKRRVLKKGQLPDGQEYSLQILKPSDAHACFELCQAEYERAEALGKCGLLRREEQEIADTLDFDAAQRKGGIFIAAVLGDNALAAVTVIDMIDTEKKGGRGRAYIGDADHPSSARQHMYFKNAVAHPDLQGSGANFVKEMYPYRLAIGLLFEEREVFLTKISGPSVKRAYDKNGWTRVDEFRLPEADDPAYDLSEEEKILATYRLTRDEALAKLEQDHPAVYQQFSELKDVFNVFATSRQTPRRPALPGAANA